MENNDENGENELFPEDSISSVSSHKSTKSSASSAMLKAAAERAAVLARVRVLKERHAIEEEEAKWRKRKMLDLEAELAATEAKIDI